ncbi:LOW QUALITY PROTEIN: coiled-coil domain-containing protein 43-like [Homalodisca vitripennis]|uniref:Coiled-coil domain-containing protein 43 n=1 Tax=Homalodisca liturata TaxID=320908 RepID=A0A1B6ISY4_9HEMI|nr:LOW QUALITY PROTEIN: coiled-coil domain-containing protein 43-like [Homalodisca vitripennis]
MAALEDDFESWLSLKLKELNTDESVFGSYITGILEGDETVEEKTEALEGILTEITENDIPLHCREILDHWKASQSNIASNVVSAPAVLDNVEEKLAKLLESNIRPTIVQRNYTDEERKIREAILAQYSQTSDQDSGEEDDVGGGGTEGKENGLFKNTNAAAVHQAEREKREKAKIDSQKKKEKDKEDREKQKQQQQEKKEKRKTQKGERRR